MKPNSVSTSWLPFLHDCADEADKIARHYFRSPHMTVRQKSNLTPVTQADEKIEKTIRDITFQRFPLLHIFGEEFGSCPVDSPLKLIIDPIDGTRNFIRGIPFFATLLAIEENQHLVAGVVSAPLTNERWWAEKNLGSFYNHKPIHVSSIQNLRESLIFYGSLYGNEAKNTPASLLNLLKQTPRQRAFGDYYNHILVAMGCGEAAVDFGLAPWDIAPLKIIVEEAGGIAKDLNGRDSIHTGSLISTNGVLYSPVQTILSSHPL